MTGDETKNVARVLAMTTTDVNPHRILPTHPSHRQGICIRIVVEDMEEGGHLVGWAARIGLRGMLWVFVQAIRVLTLDAVDVPNEKA